MDKKFDSDDLTGMFDTNDIQQNQALTMVGYIPLLFLIPLLAASTSKYAKFHANQGLILTIFAFVSAVIDKLIGFIIGWIPVIGGIVSTVVSVALGVAVLAYIVIGIVNAAQGKAKKLPVIGELLDVIK
ncbi:MAG: hypothetical protein MR503_10465 [Oscillospiraceae bacterium]|nr:hypothetical protein [Oscillospiraceae bacterium]